MTAMKRPIHTSALVDYVIPDALISDVVSIKNVNDNIDGVTSFTTGPQGGITHWRQTIFLLEHGIHVKE
ncbi:150_t:CDS:2, partial [Scutellospora calospora]